jgi:hypothetical protein
MSSHSVDTEFAAAVRERREQWEAKWSTSQRRDAPEVLYHYTNAAGFAGIVERNELWASDAAFLNDSTELVYIGEVLADVIIDLRRSYDEDRVVLGTIDQIEIQFGNTFSQLFETYVICFCQQGDLLSQWRGYPSGGGGYAIGFRSSALSQMAGMLRRVVYAREAQQQFVREAIDPLCEAMAGVPGADAQRLFDLLITEIGALGGMINECGYSFKHPGFEQEAEWRIVTLRIRDPDLIPQGSSIDNSPPSIRPTRNGLLPFIKNKLVLDEKANLPIAEVVVGPSAHPALALKAAIQLLKNAGYPHPEGLVRHSAIPLRV